ncbi:MAG TPA: electron transport complex subunit RsxG [Thiobacillus sp.]|jgi:electron transport complex protein RnfG|nr:electron transport complex subunit RsxG [Gammaproteobacteria bacterium]OYZ30247.1 MAG: electron transport complex subunit RsxG [Hydrogenophilales bacterium 16-64-40]OZA34271.1 MAG: electron transport complex subunit RsxG [Hydrogenophilales bacterium 17-64-65]HQS82366.1 electron transport complex subunit RsxG [Thiobacillus sp.]HQT33042.1 electron transport complex subunit RsxG [Thiobacillus sp.]
MIEQLKAAARNALRSGMILFVFALIATALLVFTFSRTEPTIERSRQAEKLALLSQVLPPALYDNDLLASQQAVPPHELLGTRQDSARWIARRGDTVTAVVLEAIAPDGYSGNIALLIGIDVDGNVTGVRVTAHRETPGLGDYIVRSKSPWIEQFVGKSLTAPESKRWKVAKDGGQFDARAGATITPRAVVKAVHAALNYFARNRAALLAAESAPDPAPDQETPP